MIRLELKDVVIEGLNKRPACVKLADVAKATDIPEGWIKRLARGKIEEPSGPRLQKLYEWITGKPLIEA